LPHWQENTTAVDSTNENNRDPFQNALNGQNGRLIQRNRVVYGVLKDQIRSTAPRFVPWEDGKTKKKEFIDLLQDSQEKQDIESLRRLGEGEMFTLTKMREHVRR
jgi:hypothetical protein